MIDAITTGLLIAYFQCPRKAYLLTCAKESGKLHEYEQILEQNRLTNQHKYLDILKQNKSDVFPYNIDNLKKGCEILINATLTADELQAECAILTKVGKQNYEPTIFVGTHSISETDRLGLMFIGYVLTRVQDKPPTMGYIINMESKTHRIKLTKSRKTLASLVESYYKNG